MSVGEQRQKMEARVQSAGGYEVLRRECIALVQTNEVIHWFRGHTTVDPTSLPAIIALQPRVVYYFSPKLLGSYSDEPKIPIRVRIKLFGMHADGWTFNPVLWA